MADFNDFLNTQSDPLKSVLRTSETSNIQQGTDIEKPNKANLDNLQKSQETAPEETIVEDRLPKNIPTANQEENYITAFGKNIKELSIDDINNVKPNLDNINETDYDSNAEYVQAQAKADYEAVKQQIQQDNKYYQTGNGNQYSSKIGDKYSVAMLDNIQDDKFDWDKYMMLKRYDKPIYTYGKESYIRSFVKGGASFFTNLGTSLARASKLPFDVADAFIKTSALDSQNWDYNADKYYNINKDDTYLTKLNKVLGDEMATTTRAFKSINDSLDIELGVGYDDRTNKLPYMGGNLAGNLGINFLSLGLGTLGKTIQGANALRMAASNLTVAAYGAAAFQSYALDAMAAGKDPLKAHAAGVVNGVLQSIIEKYSFEVQARHLGAGSYKSAVDVMKNYKNINKDVFVKSLYRNSVLASSISEGIEEGLQDVVEVGLKIFQDINEQTAAEILQDIACDTALGFVMSLPMAHIAARNMTKLRSRIASNFSNLNEQDANALATVFLVYSEEVANNPEFQKEYLNVLRDNILNLKPMDAGQDTAPLSTNGIVQELEDVKPSKPGATVLDTMINNKKNVKESLFELMTNPAKKEELDKVMMDTTKQIKKYATTYMGQTEEEANLTAAIMQNQIFSMAVATDMSAKQIFNAIMPKVHNRSVVSALGNYKSNSKATQDVLLKNRYNSKEKDGVFQDKVSFFKNIIDNDKSLERITQLNREGKTLEVSEFEKVSQELKATVQRETAIQQQIRKIKGQPIDYSLARDIAIYKLLGVSERSLAKFIDNKYVFDTETKHRNTRTKHLLTSIDTTNDDFLGYESAYNSQLALRVNEKGVEAAVDDEVENMAKYKQGAIYANRTRDIINTLKKDKNYQISDEDANIINKALELADTTMQDGLFGIYNASETVNPMIILSRLATGDVTAHEFAHHIIEQIITINSTMAKHTGYHFVYFNDIINSINHIMQVQGYKGSILNEDGSLNTEAHEMFANILEDYLTGRLVFDNIKYTDTDRQALVSILDSYNNLILKSSTTTFNTTNNAGIYRPNKPAADDLAERVILRRSAYSNLNLAAFLTQELDSMLKNDKLTAKEQYAQLKAIYDIALESKMLTKPAETAYLLSIIKNRVTKKNPINLFAKADGDLYVVLTNLYTDINKTNIDSIVTEGEPETQLKSSKGLKGKDRENVLYLPQEVRNNISQLVSEKIKERVKAAEEKKASEILQALREKLFDKNNETVNKVKQDIFKNIYQNKKSIVNKIDKIASAYTQEAMLENDIEQDIQEKNMMLANAKSEEEKEAINEKYAEILEQDTQFLKEQQEENKNLDKDIEDISKVISEYLSAFKGITKDDLEIISKEFAKNIIQDYSLKNQQELISNIDEKEEKKLKKSIAPERDDEQELLEEERIRYMVNNTYGEDYDALDLMLDERDKKEGVEKRYESNILPDIIGEFTQEGYKNYELEEKGKKKDNIKGTRVDDLGTKFKRATQAEKYALVQSELESMSTPLGKVTDILTLTDREVVSQDVVNDQNNKTLADYKKSLGAVLYGYTQELNTRIENFTGCNPIKLLSRSWEVFKDTFAISSNRLDYITSHFKSDKNILSGLKWAEYKSFTKHNQYVRVANSLLNKMKDKMPLETYEEFVCSVTTDDKKYRDRAIEIANEYGFLSELNNLFLVFEECKNLRIKLGYFKKGKEYYFPRQVRDVRGLLKELISDDTEPLGKILKEKHGISIEKIDTMDDNELLGLYNNTVKKELKHNKQRVISVMKPKYLKYYFPIGNALQNYFTEQKDLIFKDTFFKNIKITEKQLQRIHDEYKECPYNTAKGWYDILRQMGYLDKSNDYNNKNNKIISSYIDAIFFREASTKTLQAYRDITSITLISNVISALENFKDIGNIAAQFGLAKTLKNFTLANNDMKKNVLEKGKTFKELSLIEELTERVAVEEFKDMQYQGLSEWSGKFRKMSGFSYLDGLNKVTFLRTTIDKYNEMLTSKDTAEQKKAIDEIYKIANNNEELANEIIVTLQQDKKDMKNSDAVMYFLWYKMSENYPLSKLEMPKAYNLHNWTRYWYNFKMQPLKIANRVVYQYIDKFEKAKTFDDKMKVLADLVRILLYYSVCGIPVDYLKDILNGTPQDTLPDYAVYNITSNFLLNEYTIDSIKNNGAIKGMATSVFIPAEPVTRLFSRPVSLIPVGGKFAQRVFD